MEAAEISVNKYTPASQTLRQFHESGEQIRCIVGPVGSGKTSAATWEICYYLPTLLFTRYGLKKSTWVIVRNSYRELRDTTEKTLREWFPWGKLLAQPNEYILQYPEGYEVKILFRSCDSPGYMKKFKSLEVRGYWIDESIEVDEGTKRLLKSRIGRGKPKLDVRWGIETTNPPDVDMPTYTQFRWSSMPPGPKPDGEPLANHAGFWQKPGENKENLPLGYYDNLRLDYRDSPDWISMYIDGKPGIIIQGKAVLNNFRREYHEAKEPLVWTGGPLYLGWDHSGNCPAAVLVQIPSSRRPQVLREYYSDRLGIVDFGNEVIAKINVDFPGAQIAEHWGDPAGEATYSKKEGGFTSNAELLRQECNINVQSSEQNFRVRVESVEQALERIDGILFDPGCRLLINGGIGGYCYPENKSIMGEFLPNVLKNKYSHVWDALEYLFVRLYKPIQRQDLTDPLKKMRQEKRDYYDPLTFRMQNGK